jgi:hypothetical protein
MLDLVPINYLTNPWVNWSNLFVAYWGWLEVGCCPWPVPLLIQDGHYGSHLWFGFRQLSDERLSRACRIESILCVCWGGGGLSRGRFLSEVGVFRFSISPSWVRGFVLALWSYFYRCTHCVITITITYAVVIKAGHNIVVIIAGSTHRHLSQLFCTGKI